MLTMQLLSVKYEQTVFKLRWFTKIQYINYDKIFLFILCISNRQIPQYGQHAWLFEMFGLFELAVIFIYKMTGSKSATTRTLIGY